MAFPNEQTKVSRICFACENAGLLRHRFDSCAFVEFVLNVLELDRRGMVGSSVSICFRQFATAHEEELGVRAEHEIEAR